MSLFRPEALASQHGAQGRIVLVRPLSLALLATGAVLMLSALLGWLAWGEYTRKARIDGVLLPDGGLLKVVTPAAGVVAERRVTEGQLVQAGDVLYVLSVDRSTSGGDAQAMVQRSLGAREASLRGSLRHEQQLLASQRQAMSQRLTDMEAEARQMAAEADIHRQRLALARQVQVQWQALLNESFISAAQVQAKSQEVLTLQAQVQSYERSLRRHQRDMAALRTEVEELPLRAEGRVGELMRDLADVQRMTVEAEALRRIEVRAPAAGVVSALVAEPGQAVVSAATLASVVPAGADMQAVLYAPSSAVGFLRADQAVALRYHAFPYQKFGHQAGRVLSVSRTPVPASEAAAVPGGTEQPMYRVTVALDRQAVPAYGAAQALAAGMRLEADVLLDRRRLYEWLFEPVLSVSGRV